jgi:hypothetical protein
MNRTKEELIKHAKEFGYTNDAINKISGFLIGVGFKDESETILWKIGSGTWGEFFAWYNGREITKTVFETIMEDIFARLDAAEGAEKERYQKQIEWMCAKHIKCVDKRKERE